MVCKFCQQALKTEDITLPVVAKQIGRLIHGFSGEIFTDNHTLNTGYLQRCQTRIWIIPYILYYKVYNSNCSLVGHNLIDHINSSPKQIKFASTFYVTMKVLHVLAKMHRCSEHGLSDCVLPAAARIYRVNRIRVLHLWISQTLIISKYPLISKNIIGKIFLFLF